MNVFFGYIADAVCLGTALEYSTKIGIHNEARYEHELLVNAIEALKSIPGLRLIGTAPEKTSVLSFSRLGNSFIVAQHYPVRRWNNGGKI